MKLWTLLQPYMLQYKVAGQRFPAPTTLAGSRWHMEIERRIFLSTQDLVGMYHFSDAFHRAVIEISWLMECAISVMCFAELSLSTLHAGVSHSILPLHAGVSHSMLPLHVGVSPHGTWIAVLLETKVARSWIHPSLMFISTQHYRMHRGVSSVYHNVEGTEPPICPNTLQSSLPG